MMRGIRQQAFLTITLVTVLTLGLGLAGWYGLQQTSGAVTEFEANNLPEISKALNLSEGVAQLAALSPYVARSAKPFRLQSERNRLERRFRDLENVAASLNDQTFRETLTSHLSKFRRVLTELIERVEEELFLNEDLLAIRFTLTDLEKEIASTPHNVNLAPISVLHFLLDQTHQPFEAQKRFVDAIFQSQNVKTDADKTMIQLVARILEIRSKMADINQRKNFLLASVRAQSLQLTEQVNVFVGKLQREVADQRERVQATVNNAHTLIFIMAALVLLGMFQHYFFHYRLTRDLSTITQDMSRLAEGDIHATKIAAQRQDEIGELARAYDVFRNHSIAIKDVSRDLSEQKELLETIFHHMTNGLSFFSPQQKLVWWNRRFLEIFNLQENEVYVGQTLKEHQSLTQRDPHEHRTLTNEPLDLQHINQLRHNVPTTFERHYQTGKIIEFRSQPMPDGGFVTWYSDLTERKAIEARLKQTQKMEMLGQLTGGVAHDFNNLLAALLANLQLLSRRKDLDENQRRYVDRSLSVAEKGSNLVQRLLAFSRKQQLHPEQIDVNELILGMMDLVEYSVTPNITVTTQLSAKDTVFVDPSQLENALLNLAINSSAAMLEGGQLTFITEQVRPPESKSVYVSVSVQDTGHGIPGDLQERVLEPFFTTKALGQGSGMGLSMVYGFVKQSGGELQIDSIPNEGTQVTLSFPIKSPSQILEDDGQLPLPKPVNIPNDQKVLLVEDNSQVRLAIHEQIESLGYQVTSVESGEQAFDLLRNNVHVFALVLSDISLSGQWNGVDLKKFIEDSWPGLPVILTSGLPKESLEKHYKLSPHEVFLQKPISFTNLKFILGR